MYWLWKIRMFGSNIEYFCLKELKWENDVESGQKNKWTLHVNAFCPAMEFVLIFFYIIIHSSINFSINRGSWRKFVVSIRIFVDSKNEWPERRFIVSWFDWFNLWKKYHKLLFNRKSVMKNTVQIIANGDDNVRWMQSKMMSGEEIFVLDVVNVNRSHRQK